MLAILFALFLTTTESPRLAYFRYAPPPLFDLPDSPPGVGTLPTSFTLAFECVDWISCPQRFVLVVDGERRPLAPDQFDEVIGIPPFTHVYETPMLLPPGYHTIAFVGVDVSADGTSESPQSITTTLRVVGASSIAPPLKVRIQ